MSKAKGMDTKMKVVILAGGFGTRISEESHLKPKPMIEIGTSPILLHIMKIYSAQGFNDFIICAGYKQEVIKKMALCPNNAIDKKLAKMYAEKVTVNLENRSSLDPEDFWKTMQMIAVANKAMMHLT